MWFSLLFWDLASGRDLSTSMLPFLVNMDCLLHFMLACSDVATADYLKSIFKPVQAFIEASDHDLYLLALRTSCFIDIAICMYVYIYLSIYI